MKKACSFLLIFCMCICTSLQFSACSTEDKTFNGFVFGTFYEIRLNGKSATQTMERLNQELAYLHSIFSLNAADAATSDVIAINKASANTDVPIHAETAELLSLALELYDTTEGAFHIALFPLIDLWGFTPGNTPALPTQTDIETQLQFCNPHGIMVTQNASNQTFVRKQNANIGIDLGGIAKGYAVNRCLEIVQNAKLKNAYINIGGNIGVYGEKSYNIGIRKPEIGENDIFGYLTLQNTTIATSGSYERYFIENDVVYHHILDAKTGYPAQSDLVSVSIIGDNSALCDAYATAVFIMGSDAGRAFLEKNNLSAICVTKDRNVFVTGEYPMQILSEDYILQ